MSAERLHQAARHIRDRRHTRYDAALADWLDQTAEWVTRAVQPAPSYLIHPLAVADAILADLDACIDRHPAGRGRS